MWMVYPRVNYATGLIKPSSIPHFWYLIGKKWLVPQSWLLEMCWPYTFCSESICVSVTNVWLLRNTTVFCHHRKLHTRTPFFLNNWPYTTETVGKFGLTLKKPSLWKLASQYSRWDLEMLSFRKAEQLACAVGDYSESFRRSGQVNCLGWPCPVKIIHVGFLLNFLMPLPREE